MFVRGGFADASKAGLIVLAETAIPFEDFNADKLAEQIKNAEEDLADAKDDQKPLGPGEARPPARAEGRHKALGRRGCAAIEPDLPTNPPGQDRATTDGLLRR